MQGSKSTTTPSGQHHFEDESLDRIGSGRSALHDVLARRLALDVAHVSGGTLVDAMGNDLKEE